MELQHLCKTAEGSALVKLIQDRENQCKTTPPPTTHRSRRTYLQNETLNRLITSIPSSITNSFSNKSVTQDKETAPKCPSTRNLFGNDDSDNETNSNNPNDPNNDPFITALRQKAKENTSTLLLQVLGLLATHQTSNTQTDLEENNTQDITPTISLQHIQEIQDNTLALQQETNKLQLTTIQLTTRHYIHSAKQRQRLIKIIKDIKLDLPIHANNLLLSEWLNNSYQTLEARLKTERIGSINRIYNQGTVPSLLRKRQSLEKEKVKIGEETMVVLEQLEKYQSMEKKNDLKFQEIALEFTKVRNEVAIARQHLIAVTNGMGGSGIEDKNGDDDNNNK